MNKTLGILGLSMKAGQLVSGEYGVSETIRSGQAYLTIVAEDASDNTKKKFTNMCAHYQVPLIIGFEKTKLGQAIGKPYRATICVKDLNLAKAIEKTWR